MRCHNERELTQLEGKEIVESFNFNVREGGRGDEVRESNFFCVLNKGKADPLDKRGQKLCRTS